MLEWESLTHDLLAPTGPFELGALVDLGRVEDAGETPMVEDRRFRPGDGATAKRVLQAK